MAIIPQLIQELTIVDTEIENLVKSITAEFESLRKVTTSHDPFFMDPNFLTGPFFAHSTVLQEGVYKLVSYMSDTSYHNIPAIIQALCVRIKYKDDVLGVLPQIEKEINKSLHLFEPLQLSQILFNLNYYFPKSGKVPFRESIRKLIADDFQILNTTERAVALMSLKTFNCTSIHRVFLKDIRDNSDYLIKIHQDSPAALLAYLQAFNLSRLPKVKRKSRGVEPSAAYEASLFFGKYYDFFLEKWDSFNSIEKLTLINICYYMKQNNLFEIYDLFEEYILEKKSDLEIYQLSRYLHLMATFNNGKATGSDDFWLEISQFITQSTEASSYLKSDLFRIVESFSVANTPAFNSVLQWARPCLIEHLKNKNLTQTETVMISKVLLLSQVEDQDLTAETIRALSFHRYNFPLVGYGFIKLLRYKSGVLYPSWNYDYFDSRCFNSEMSNSPLILVEESHRNRVSEVYNTLKAAGSDLDIFTLIDWENTGIVDIAFPEHRVGIIIDSVSNPLTDRSSKTSFNQCLASVMRSNGWIILEVNYFEFSEGGIQFAEQLIDQLKQGYTEAIQKQGELEDILRNRNLMRLEQFVEDLMPDAFNREEAEMFINF